ncbi:MAG: DUF2358 domain-containing protein [Cyanothece sp. SIO1E1]|nr:DUF2358 domain-containing protein [Cyanothece sp. SIO1E1]
MDIIQVLKQDYQRFPANPTYEIYAENVFFQDPLNRFQGLDRYKKMIGFIETWFINPNLELHQIEQSGNQIETHWTLRWTTPLPWKPQMVIKGWTEMMLNSEGLINSHIDYWECSRFDVLKQLIFPPKD